MALDPENLLHILFCHMQSLRIDIIYFFFPPLLWLFSYVKPPEPDVFKARPMSK